MIKFNLHKAQIIPQYHIKINRSFFYKKYAAILLLKAKQLSQHMNIAAIAGQNKHKSAFARPHICHHLIRRHAFKPHIFHCITLRIVICLHHNIAQVCHCMQCWRINIF